VLVTFIYLFRFKLIFSIQMLGDRMLLVYKIEYKLGDLEMEHVCLETIFGFSITHAVLTTFCNLHAMFCPCEIFVQD
jgi:hypothetical protein